MSTPPTKQQQQAKQIEYRSKLTYKLDQYGNHIPLTNKERIKKYRELAPLVHPDKHPNDVKAVPFTKILNKVNDELREEYQQEKKRIINLLSTGSYDVSEFIDDERHKNMVLEAKKELQAKTEQERLNNERRKRNAAEDEARKKALQKEERIEAERIEKQRIEKQRIEKQRVATQARNKR